MSHGMYYESHHKITQLQQSSQQWNSRT